MGRVPVGEPDDDVLAYLTPEARARVAIDRMLREAGWAVQDRTKANLAAARGVAIREFTLKPGHGEADYLLFVDGQAVGVIEAKKQGETLTGVAWQTGRYCAGLPDAVPTPFEGELAFLYQSTDVEARFTNGLDPEPRSRRVFWFHRPETLASWVAAFYGKPLAPTLRHRLRAMPELATDGLWPAQVVAVRNLEASLAADRPRALVQMATGSGKTYTAANLAYRLVRHADATRVLFLVDRANLGRQTLKEFQSFTVPGDGRKFTDLYNVQHLTSQTVDRTARVTISTIQRLYSILRGDAELDPEVDEHSADAVAPAQPVEVAYSPALPIETFDVIVVDECHRSIYGVWRQVLDYFDAFTVGLTATPNKQALGFFDQNLVMEYGHEQAVADRVNVDFDVYRIRTEITEQGGVIDAGLVTGFRDRQSRALRWETLDDEVAYAASELDRAVVARDQIRTVIRTFRERLPEIFPGREHVPKTLIFAKDDSHADDIVQIVREEFAKGDDFAVKITYKSTGVKPEEMIKAFRNSYNPRIAVTVDMIATGTDVKPIECVFFMRMVKSRTYFEQMKGRGVRVISPTDLQAVTPDAKAKDRFVIVDAVGATEAELLESGPLDRQPTVPLEKLLLDLSYGARDEELVSTIAGRLARLDRKLTRDDREELRGLAGGLDLSDIVRGIVAAIDPDAEGDPAARVEAAVAPLATNGELRERLVEVRRSYEQAIDETSKDTVLEAGFSHDATARARRTVDSFREFIEAHHDEITALQVLYSRPHRERLTFREIKELANAIARPPYRWTPEALWHAYEQLDRSRVRGSGGRVLTDLVSLVRFALEQESELAPYPERVAERFAAWLLQQENAGRHFTPEQVAWLERIRDHVAASLAITRDDLYEMPFNERGGLGKAVELFGDELDPLLAELTEVLAA